MMTDAVAALWSILNKNSGEIRIDDAKKILSSEGYDEKTVEEALDILYKLYFIEYTNDENGNGVIIKKRNILGIPFDDLPCLGCEHLHECDVGGIYSPERCPYFQLWLNKVKNGFKVKHKLYLKFG